MALLVVDFRGAEGLNSRDFCLFFSSFFLSFVNTISSTLPNFSAGDLALHLKVDTMVQHHEHDALIGSFSHLANLPREKEALHALKKIASVVKPIMRARGWKVGQLAEFYPNENNLLGRASPTSSESRVLR